MTGLNHPYRDAPFTRDWPARHVPLLYRLRLLFADPRLLWLLQHGRYTLSTRISEHKSRNADHADEWHTTFEFTTGDGHIERAQATTSIPDFFAEQEPLLYDPAWPDHSTLLRHLPGAPAILEDGTITLAW